MTLNTLFIFGTRPEAIKMAPVINVLKNHPMIRNQVCVTGQHQEMLNSVLSVFNIHPDYNLDVMTVNQDLSSLTAKMLLGLANIFKQYKPDLVFVHGDTTTTLTASLSAYYHRIPTAHVEAGLRTGDIYLPWPEEVNRKLAGALASLHFAPTKQARLNLLNEGVNPDTIHVTGNTVIDALHDAVNIIEKDHVLTESLRKTFPFVNKQRKYILVTGHRRENFGQGFEQICQALLILAQRFQDLDIVYPVHLNPNVQKPVKQLLGSMPNIYLIEPQEYLPFVYLMKNAWIILTDSGGIQEEAPSLGKPVLVMRDKTERPEAVNEGTVKLVGANTTRIVESVTHLLNNQDDYYKMSQAKNPYGDGNAAQRILSIIEQKLPVPHTNTRKELTTALNE